MLGGTDHLLFGVADHDLSVVETRNTASNKDQVKARVDTDDGEVLGRDALTAHMTRHFLSGPHSAWILEKHSHSMNATGETVGDIPDVHLSNLLNDGKGRHRDSHVDP